eukprot:189384_1
MPKKGKKKGKKKKTNGKRKGKSKKEIEKQKAKTKKFQAALKKTRGNVRDGCRNKNNIPKNNGKEMKQEKKSNTSADEKSELSNNEDDEKKHHELRRGKVFEFGNEDQYGSQLQHFSDKWYKNGKNQNDVNVKNLGIYLNAVIRGYKASLNRNLDHGYVKFGCYARTFCESICVYFLNGKVKNSLNDNIDKLRETKKNFPHDEMHDVRKTTNIVVHAVKYNIDAEDRYTTDKEQQMIWTHIYVIAEWADDQIKSPVENSDCPPKIQ